MPVVAIDRPPRPEDRSHLPPQWVLDAIEHEFTTVMPKMTWGCFTFIYTERSRGRCSWEVTCPFHRKSISTGCRKTKDFDVVQAADPDVHYLAVRWLKYWASAARGFTCQRYHLRNWRVRLDDVPVPEVLSSATFSKRMYQPLCGLTTS